MAIPLVHVGKSAIDPRELARRAIRDVRWLEEVLAGLKAETARVKYGCAKALRVISEERPEVLYPHFDFFMSLLGAENTILQWESLYVISQLARVDEKERIEAVFGRYFASIPGPVMITAANAIKGGARIAQAKPALAPRIIKEILKVERARYRTAECRNVAIGHAIEALMEMIALAPDAGAVSPFVQRQTKNTRPATRRKAERLLKQLQRHAKNSSASRS